jgi:Fibronectin type III domain
VTGLTNGTAYYFTVAALSKARLQGAKSGEASATPPAASASATGLASGSPSGGATATAAGSRGAPTGLTATPGNAEVGLSWTAPAAASGPPASYHVYEGTSPGFTLGAPVMSTTGTNATVTGLTNGTTYYFVVAAVNASGTVSVASAEASAEPLATAVLASATQKVPKPVIISLVAVAAAAIAAALALTARWRPRPAPDHHRPAARGQHPGGQHPGGQHLDGQHPDGQLPAAELPGAVTAAAHFPGVDLMDGHVPATNLNAAGPPGPSHLGGQAGAEHPGSAESYHSSVSWWEKPQTHPGPTRTS